MSDNPDRMSPCLEYEHRVRDDGHVEVRLLLNKEYASPQEPHSISTGQIAGWRYIILVANHAYYMANLGLGPSMGKVTHQTREAADYLKGLARFSSGMVSALIERQSS